MGALRQLWNMNNSSKLNLLNANIVCDGNSITYGVETTTPYPTLLRNYFNGIGSNYNFNVTVTNKGISGQTSAQMEADASTDIDPLIQSGKLNLLIGWEITNSLYYGASLAQTYSDISTYYLHRKNAGWKVIAVTALYRPGTTAQVNADIDSCNQMIRDNYKQYADYLIDVRQYSKFTTDLPWPYSASSVHPNSVGTEEYLYKVFVPFIESIIKSNGSYVDIAPAPFNTYKNLKSLYIAKSNSDFQLSDTNVQKWKDRTSNHYDLNAGANYRTFDVTNKLVNCSNINQLLGTTNEIILGNNDFTIILYENLTYKNATSTFLSYDSSNYYIGEIDSSTFRISCYNSVSTFSNVIFSKGTIPGGVKKHIIKRTNLVFSWSINGVPLVKGIDGTSINSVINFKSLGFSSFVSLGDLKAIAVFNKSLNSAEETSIIAGIDSELV